MKLIETIGWSPKPGATGLAWLIAVAAFWSVVTPAAFAQGSYSFETLAGSGGTSSCLDATGLAASFLNPSGVAIDSNGNFFVADTGNNLIRKITPAGVVTTVAGSPGAVGSADGIGTAARFNSPQGIAVDRAGNIYVADTSNFIVRKITPDGAVTTLAGTAGMYGSSDGSGAAATFSFVTSIAVNSAGILYVADIFGHSIRQITPAGVVTTLAGSPNAYGTDNGIGSAASFTMPSGVAVDNAGNVYAVEYFASDVRKVTPAGGVTRIAGFPNASGSRDGTAAQFVSPSAIAVDGLGNVYVMDGGAPVLFSGLGRGSAVRQIAPTGYVTTLAGDAIQPGQADGSGSAAGFNNSRGLVVEPAGTLVVADSGNHMFRRVTTAGVVTTFSGGAGAPGFIDAGGAAARFNGPTGLGIDSAGNLLVADSGNQSIRRITPAGLVSTLLIGDNLPQVRTPGVTGDANGALYWISAGCQIVKTMGSASSVLAGTLQIGSADGPANSASFNGPQGIVADSLGNVYIADTGNHTIRKVTPAGDVTTLAGLAGHSGTDDGTGSAARFSSPNGIAIDKTGNLYVTDLENFTVRKISPAGLVTTLAGSAGSLGSSDGLGGVARFSRPQGIAVDLTGNVLVADTDNHLIRKITPAGMVSTIGGLAGTVNYAAGIGSAAHFPKPVGIAVDSLGRIYVSDNVYNTIVVGKVSSVPAKGMTSDFNGDGQTDILWQNTSTGERFIWTMNGSGHIGGAGLGIVPTAWSIAVTADFNGDGQEDILWQNTSTGERYIWFMNGAGHIDGASLGVVATEWSIVGTADFNRDGQADILWQNTVTGERYIWLMRGSGHLADISLGVVPTQWSIVGTADFDGDGQTDILWENTNTGERYLWFMSGAGHRADAGFGIVPTQWSIATAADFNGDGHPDILWQNTVTGQRYLWLMNGTAHQSDVDLGMVDLNWRIAR